MTLTLGKCNLACVDCREVVRVTPTLVSRETTTRP